MSDSAEEESSGDSRERIEAGEGRSGPPTAEVVSSAVLTLPPSVQSDFDIWFVDDLGVASAVAGPESVSSILIGGNETR